MSDKLFRALLALASLALALSIANSAALFFAYREINAKVAVIETQNSVAPSKAQTSAEDSQTSSDEAEIYDAYITVEEPQEFYEDEEATDGETVPVKYSHLRDATLSAMIKRVIRDLDKSYYVSIGGDDEFDYGLHGGISVMGHYIASLVSYEEVLELLLPHKLFVSGPHTDEKPDLNNNDSFGHYNPEAIRHIREVFQETFSDQEFLRETAKLYQKHLRLRFNAMLSCYSEINESASFKAKLVEAYETRRSFSGDSYFCDQENYDIHAIPTFWLRRAIDGTDLEFYEILQIIKTAYAPYISRQLER
jgi:hypothetical protein